MNLPILIAPIIALFCLMSLHDSLMHPLRACLFRCCASLLPVFLSAYHCVQAPGENVLLLSALCLYLASDGMQDIRLHAAMILRSSAHLLLCCYALRNASLTVDAVAVLLILLTVCGILVHRWQNAFLGSHQRVILACYILMLCAAGCCGFAFAALRTVQAIRFGAGCLCLVMANIMAIRSLADVTDKPFRLTMLLLRMTAMLLIAL